MPVLWVYRGVTRSPFVTHGVIILMCGLTVFAKQLILSVLLNPEQSEKQKQSFTKCVYTLFLWTRGKGRVLYDFEMDSSCL